MARPKVTRVKFKSLEECEQAMHALLVATSSLVVLLAERDWAVATKQKEFESHIDILRAQKSELEEALKDYYMAHLGEIEKDGRKSLQLANGVMGRRDNPPKLVPLNRSWTWAAVLVKVRSFFGDRFLRMCDPELDKDRIKAEMPPERMRECGLKLACDETFYAEPERPPKGAR